MCLCSFAEKNINSKRNGAKCKDHKGGRQLFLNSLHTVNSQAKKEMLKLF